MEIFCFALTEHLPDLGDPGSEARMTWLDDKDDMHWEARMT